MLTKLRPKSGDQVAIFNCPEDFLPEVPSGISVAHNHAEGATILIIFVSASSDFVQYDDLLDHHRQGQSAVWFAYPKKSGSISSEITRDKGWDRIMRQGWHPVSQVSLGDDWSALRFKWESPDTDLVAQQYAGSKSHLLPVYEKVLAFVQALGDDITIGTRKTYVSASRKSQFLVLQPSSQYISIGLRLVGDIHDVLVEPSRNVGGGSITHAIRLSDVAHFGPEIKKWIVAAYEQNGGRN